MSDVVIAVENLSKQYRLGTIGGRTLRADLSRWWAKRRGQPAPYLRIGQEEQAKRFGETIWALRDALAQASMPFPPESSNRFSATSLENMRCGQYNGPGWML